MTPGGSNNGGSLRRDPATSASNGDGDVFAKRYVRVHGIDFAFIDEGRGPSVLLLHGFPDTSYLWRHQIPVLRDAGFRVIAPDLRGFGDSGKPKRIDDYALRNILSDVAGLLTAVGVPRAHIVGHDWGAAVAWLLAALMPRRVDHLVVLSVGHPSVFQRPTPEQREKSWYVLLYQFPGVAEELLRRHNFRLYRELMRDEGDVDRYVKDFSKPGALTAALNWYRANLHPSSELNPPRQLPQIAAPTLGIWSTGDRAMLERQMTDSARFVRGEWRYERIDGASHWIPLDAPNRLNDLLLEFLGSHVTTANTRRRRRF